MNELKLHFKESDFGVKFIGVFELEQLDKYNTVKSGTTFIQGMVRSIVDNKKKVIKLVSVLSDHSERDKIIMDGSIGIQSVVSDKFPSPLKPTELQNTIFLNVKNLQFNQVLKYEIIDDYRVWKTTCSFSKYLFNQNHEFTYDFFYFGTNKQQSTLIGMYCEIPISDFNKYVYMRNLYISDYTGCTEIEVSDEDD
jgi:hypothetical protein